ncbi:MAG: glycosyltransferase family protein [Candidatus Baldrarchaeia archaeon]
MGRDFDHTLLQPLKDAGIFLVQWIPDEYGPDDGQAGKWFEGIRGIYDLMMLETRGIVPLLEGYATDVIWIPQFFDHRYHTCIEKRGQYAFDVGFLGGPNPVQSSIRLSFLTKLIGDGYDVQVGGGDFFWGYYRNMIPPTKYFSNGILIGGEMAKFYSRARIGVNFINDKLPQYELGFSNRVLKTIGCGCCLVTPEILGFDELFTDGEHCVTYKPIDYHDFRDKIAFFLEHPREREEIATKGRRFVLENYNIDKITAGFIDEIKKRM